MLVRREAIDFQRGDWEATKDSKVDNDCGDCGSVPSMYPGAAFAFACGGVS